VLATADVCRRAKYCEKVVEESVRSKCLLPDTYGRFFPTLFHTLVARLAAKMTCVYSRGKEHFSYIHIDYRFLKLDKSIEKVTKFKYLVS
jgi:hypothetical protein